ncbi:amidohydrolase family protein [Halobellus ruber]|uniref:amidohydrolase family protein n=1 Tax=Halobellus ruber TaxID=2761102 RepID=UPI001C8A6CEB|nr:amidohydrolase family protein [Halobellus ruber]
MLANLATEEAGQAVYLSHSWRGYAVSLDARAGYRLPSGSSRTSRGGRSTTTGSGRSTNAPRRPTRRCGSTPQLRERYEWASEYIEHRLCGWRFDTTLGLSRLVFGGVMAAYPDLGIVPHHGGGMVPYYRRRVRMSYQQRQAYPGFHERAADRSEPAEEYFTRVDADTAVPGSTPALECVESFFDAGNVVFGTDYPFSIERGRRTLEVTIDAVEGTNVGVDTREDIFPGTRYD